MSEKVHIPSHKRQIIESALVTGLGFSRACDLAQVDIKTASELIRQEPEWKNELEEKLMIASRNMLVVSNDHLSKRKYDKWKAQLKEIHKFQTRLILWEHECKKDQVNPNVIIRLIAEYSTLDDVATAVGMTRSEIYQYAQANETLAIWMEQKNLI